MAGERVVTLQEIYATLLQREQIARQQLQQILDQNSAISTGLVDVANNQQLTEASIVLPLFIQAFAEGLTPEQFAEKYPLFSTLDITQILFQILQDRELGTFVGDPIQGLLGNGRNENGQQDLVEDVRLVRTSITGRETAADVETYQDITWDEDYLPYREYLQEHGMIHKDDSGVSWVARANIEALLNVQNPGQLLGQVISIQLRGNNLQSKRQSEIVIEGMYLTGYKNTNRFFTLNDVYLILKTVRLDRLQTKKKTLILDGELGIPFVPSSGQTDESLVTQGDGKVGEVSEIRVGKIVPEDFLQETKILLEQGEGFILFQQNNYVREAVIERVLIRILKSKHREKVSAVFREALEACDSISHLTGNALFADNSYKTHWFFKIEDVLTVIHHLYVKGLIEGEDHEPVASLTWDEFTDELGSIAELKQLNWFFSWIRGAKISRDETFCFNWEKTRELFISESGDNRVVQFMESEFLDRNPSDITLSQLLKCIQWTMQQGNTLTRPFAL